MQAAAGGGLIAGETYAENEASAMKSRSKCSWIALFAALGLAMNVGAAEPPTHVSTATLRDTVWTLATDDTELTLTVEKNAIRLIGLRNPEEKWNWIPAPSPAPMPGVQTGKNYQPLNWEFREATEDRTHGRQLTLRFTSANPALELKSVWRALPGPGPVENEVAIENKSGGDITFGPAIAAAEVMLAADAAVTLHRAEKTAVGTGKVFEDVIGPKANFSTDARIIPLVIFAVGPRHGAYLGFEWELGGFKVSSQADPLRITASVQPITENVTRASGGKFLIPSVYYGVYKGDIDDGSNRFKRWFWNHKITRSLYNNKDEPWVEVCMQEIGGNGSASITGKTPQNVYDRLAAVGAELVKMDFWDGTGKCWYNQRDWTFRPEIWPKGFDFAAKAHKAGLKASLYMGGTYMDGDLTTIAGRDAELQAVLARYDKGWFDVWRTDLYTAPREPMPQTYQGVANFLDIQDQMIKNRPGYRYENCCNGGKYKGFAVCRRMTFCTMNDEDSTAWKTRTTYFSNSFAINPVQLKSDLGPAESAYDLRTDMLGSILTWAADNPVYRQHIALYKARQRPILRGANVYHILPMPDGTNWDGLQFHNPDLDRGSVFLFKPSVKAADGDSKVIKLKGLDRKATYALAFQDRVALNCSKTGAQLMDQGITVSGMSGDRAAEIIWIEKPKPATEPMWTSEPSQWQRVPNAVEAPAGGVVLGDDGLFRQSMNKHTTYLLADAKLDDMVFRFRKIAGAENPPGKPRGWENMFPAHAAQFLMGAGNTLRWGENAQLRQRMNQVIDALKACRTPDGMLAAPAGAGEEGYSFMLLAHGLDAAARAGNRDAHDLLAAWAKWYCQRVEKETAGNPRARALEGQNYFAASGLMLAHFAPGGTPADVLDAYQHVYPAWMRQLTDRNLEGIWKTCRGHPHSAYCYGWIGFLDIYRATGDRRLLDAMLGGWELYDAHWLHPGGTLAICEGDLAYPPDSLFLTPQAHTGETCSMAWWARFNQKLHLLFPAEEKYVADLEKVIYNVGLANQVGQSISYHTHLEGQKDRAGIEHTCCEVSGTYLYSTLPEYIYSIAQDGLYVNLFEPSSIAWKHGGRTCELTMTSRFPYQPEVSLRLAAAEPMPMKLRVRVPGWAIAEMPIRVNGQETAVGKPGSYVVLDRTWRAGDTVTFTLPIGFRAVPYEGADRIPGHPRYAILYGPVLMAAVAPLSDKNKVELPDFVFLDNQKKVDANNIKQLKKWTYMVRIAHDPAAPKDWLTPKADQPLAFSVIGQAEPYLKPYWQIDKESFTCFPVLQAPLPSKSPTTGQNVEP